MTGNAQLLSIVNITRFDETALLALFTGSLEKAGSMHFADHEVEAEFLLRAVTPYLRTSLAMLNAVKKDLSAIERRACGPLTQRASLKEVIFDIGKLARRALAEIGEWERKAG